MSKSKRYVVICNGKDDQEFATENLATEYIIGMGLRLSNLYTVITCECGEEIWCNGFTNSCDNCDNEYDREGSLLRPRSEWDWGYED